MWEAAQGNEWLRWRVCEKPLARFIRVWTGVGKQADKGALAGRGTSLFKGRWMTYHCAFRKGQYSQRNHNSLTTPPLTPPSPPNKRGVYWSSSQSVAPRTAVSTRFRNLLEMQITGFQTYWIRNSGGRSLLAIWSLTRAPGGPCAC